MTEEVMSYEEWLDSLERLYFTNEASFALKALKSGEDLLVNIERQRREAYAAYLKTQKKH